MADKRTHVSMRGWNEAQVKKAIGMVENGHDVVLDTERGGVGVRPSDSVRSIREKYESLEAARQLRRLGF